MIMHRPSVPDGRLTPAMTSSKDFGTLIRFAECFAKRDNFLKTIDGTYSQDGNGFISSAELRHLLTTLGEKLSDEEAEQLLAGHEDNKVNISWSWSLV